MSARGFSRCRSAALRRLVAGALTGVLAAALGAATGFAAPLAAPTLVPPRVTLANPAIQDQDDMCIWIHPTDHSLSTIVATDKAADKVFVYDLQGATLQTIAVAGKPGNIDVRYNFHIDGNPTDVVAFNNRADSTIQVFRVDPATRQLTRIDNGAIKTGDNYGFCLYRGRAPNSLYGFTTAETGVIEQYELHDQGGQVAGSRVRSWDLGFVTEGCVADDESGFAYFSEEPVGIWKVGAEPTDPVSPTLIAAVGDSGLTADVEGLTIYYAAGGGGYLIASSQGSSEYKVYERMPPHRYVETFTISGVSSTDGIDVINVNLGPAFPSGIFCVHNDTPIPKPVVVCAYQDAGR